MRQRKHIIDPAKQGEPRQMTGAQMVWEALYLEGVDTVFGHPGGAILPTYDALSKYEAEGKIHHVLVRHEQCAGHMADGYARSTGKVGVCIVTSGPGATNLVTGLATAQMDSVPMVAITGQVPTNLLGTDAFQESDVVGVTQPVVKHNYLVTDVHELRGEAANRMYTNDFAVRRNDQLQHAFLGLGNLTASDFLEIRSTHNRARKVLFRLRLRQTNTGQFRYGVDPGRNELTESSGASTQDVTGNPASLFHGSRRE